MYWGHHLIGNFGRCNPTKIRTKQNIINFANTLVREIDMVPYGPPQVVYFGSGNKAGYTLVQLIETSNICAHFVEETNDVYLDVFSCKQFDRETVRKIFRSHFENQTEKMLLLKRQAPTKNEKTMYVPELE
jgi:S-adenosylmethionine/arginine decarboxylase-like enzyme